MKVRQPRVHDRRQGEEAEPFSSKILPPYLRKTRSIEELLPWLYLKGISTGDFAEALQSLLGEDAPREQRCWLHKTANVLNNLPKSVQPRAKADIHEIWMAESREDAQRAFDAFLEKYQAK